ncbi:Periplasmic chaperone and peptidyl-prolyl cis-trans isomerase of outer membrane proteins SurA [hydrothermal vent metagenome]|uniref:Periplasmic chaperone and peptidyl-prolyl cis-trans isomerase of outer membrane proteins SurA n=1 Tax=hydrothermal vent metagenome TaxID=652676 RepID=A0A3B0YEU2_9ZZZZ
MVSLATLIDLKTESIMKLTSLLLTLVILLPAQLFANVPLNYIVAVVNDNVVLKSELDNRERLITEQLQQQNAKLPPRDLLRKQVLDRLIMENLQLQIAERSGVRVDDETLNSSLRNMAKQNEMTLTEFREVLEKDGFDYLAFREEFRNQIIMNQIRQQMVDNRIQVTDQEIDNLLESAAEFNDQSREYLLSHILISLPEAASPEQIQSAKQRANDILTRLNDGADFKQMAIAESNSQDALNGGDLGWRKTGQLPSFFSDVVGQLQSGQISELIRTPSGFHIVKIEDVRGDEKHTIHQTKASHILLRPDTLISENEVKIRMDQLYERIQGGDSFSELASAHSQDPGSASQGGSLDWVTPGQMVPEFEKAMNKLEIGEVSKPVKSRFGWHLIKVLDRRQHDDTVAYRRARARDSIRQRKTDEELEIWLRRLRDESYVEYINNGS